MAHRYFVDPLPRQGTARLDGEVAHHLGTVLRKRAGDEIVLGDGRGSTALARVVAASKGTVEVEVGAAVAAPLPRVRVQLAFAPPRLARAEWLFEHATEVGVAVFRPLWTERVRPQG